MPLMRSSWLRYGLLAGAVSAAATLALGLLQASVKSDYCQAGALGVGHPAASDFALTLAGPALLFVLAWGAGRQAMAAGASKGQARLAGLVTGTISGIGTLALTVVQFDGYTACLVRSGFAGPGMDMRPHLSGYGPGGDRHRRRTGLRRGFGGGRNVP